MTYSPTRRSLIAGAAALSAMPLVPNDASASTDMSMPKLKVAILSRRRPDLSHAQYVEHWRDVHAPLFSSQPTVKANVRRYVQSRTTDDTPLGFPMGNVDGIAEVWLDSLPNFLRIFTSANYRDVIRIDEEKFTDGPQCDVIFAKEHVVIGDGPYPPAGTGTPLLKVDILVRRRPDLTREAFAQHWRDVHAPMFASLPAVKQHVRRYVQSHVTADRPAGFPISDVDGVAQLWFDDIAGFHAMYDSADYRDMVIPDADTFADGARSEFVFSNEFPIIV